jgi:hypothetical protein
MRSVRWDAGGAEERRNDFLDVFKLFFYYLFSLLGAAGPPRGRPLPSRSVIASPSWPHVKCFDNRPLRQQKIFSCRFGKWLSLC